MNVLNTRCYLLEETASLVFLEAFSFYDVVEKFTTAGVLHDKEELTRSLDDL